MIIIESSKILFFFKILMGTQKDSFEIYRKFGYASSKKFANRKLGYGLEDPVFKCWKRQDTHKPALQQVQEFFLRMQSGRSVRLITHLHLVPALRKREC
jgi:hypothetical protein